MQGPSGAVGSLGPADKGTVPSCSVRSSSPEPADSAKVDNLRQRLALTRFTWRVRLVDTGRMGRCPNRNPAGEHSNMNSMARISRGWRPAEPGD